eukprot:TRINITY_DN25031_c0_g1_i1.p1 TRINITY_DN25031_c0_g1~~TRINITY_DN25031_c0_g1_i1.p1  ORF type:complete len:460 (+),score=84.00 TRINITY_DN25031_c0_g1_i1:60-1382(+)
MCIRDSCSFDPNQRPKLRSLVSNFRHAVNYQCREFLPKMPLLLETNKQAQLLARRFKFKRRADQNIVRMTHSSRFIGSVNESGIPTQLGVIFSHPGRFLVREFGATTGSFTLASEDFAFVGKCEGGVPSSVTHILMGKEVIHGRQHPTMNERLHEFTTVIKGNPVASDAFGRLWYTNSRWESIAYNSEECLFVRFQKLRSDVPDHPDNRRYPAEILFCAEGVPIELVTFEPSPIPSQKMPYICEYINILGDYWRAKMDSEGVLVGKRHGREGGKGFSMVGKVGYDKIERLRYSRPCHFKNRISGEYFEGAFVGFPNQFITSCEAPKIGEGTGLVKHPNGEIYEGAFLNGQRSGKGKLTCAYDSPFQEFEGEFRWNEPFGEGTLVLKNGDKFTGVVYGWSWLGRGFVTKRDGTRIDGRFLIQRESHMGNASFVREQSHEID